MSPQVADVRLTLIWAETNLALLAAAAKPAPLGALGRAATYAYLFDALRRAEVPAGAPESLALPWPAPRAAQRFWRAYLNVGRGRMLTAVEGADAWKQLVPLRGPLPCEITIPDQRVRVTAEGFYYPHGIALAVTVSGLWPDAPRELPDVTTLLHELVAGDRPVLVEWTGAAGPASTSLDDFATQALTWLRESAFGAGAQPGIAVNRPYSVTSFVRLNQVDPTVATPDQGPVHRTLEAVTAWLPDWTINQLPPLASRCAAIRPAPPSHVCYAGAHGHAIWFPAPAVAGRRTLSCYHRNQLFAALQVESLSEMLRRVDQQLTAGGALSPAADQCAKLAAGIVGRLYGGVDDTYRSGSARQHIERRGFVDAVNSMRTRYRVPLLH
jgi:hypothetical protein